MVDLAILAQVTTLDESHRDERDRTVESDGRAGARIFSATSRFSRSGRDR
jgi:hypothetical protein